MMEMIIIGKLVMVMLVSIAAALGFGII